MHACMLTHTHICRRRHSLQQEHTAAAAPIRCPAVCVHVLLDERPLSAHASSQTRCRLAQLMLQAGFPVLGQGVAGEAHEGQHGTPDGAQLLGRRPLLLQEVPARPRLHQQAQHKQHRHCTSRRRAESIDLHHDFDQLIGNSQRILNGSTCPDGSMMGPENYLHCSMFRGTQSELTIFELEHIS